MPTDPQSKPATRTKLKPVRFAVSELPLVAAFLKGRDFSTVVRAYVLGQTPKRARARSEPNAAMAPSDVSVGVPFTAAEWAAVAAKLQGRDVVDVVRAYLLDAPIPDPEPQPVRPTVERRQLSEFEAQQIRQLAWWGSNLNQIAKACNIARGAAPGVITALVRLERAILTFTRETAGIRQLLRPPQKPRAEKAE